MDERIKSLRQELGMTQQAFGDRLGIKRNTVAQYEIGRNPPTDTVITLICREFDVSEEWLRNGTGPMFVEKTRDDFKQRLLAALSRLDESEWAMLEQVARKLLDELKG